MALILLVIISIFWMGLIVSLIACNKSWQPEAIVGTMIIIITSISIELLKTTSIPPWSGPIAVIIFQAIIAIRIYRKGKHRLKD